MTKTNQLRHTYTEESQCVIFRLYDYLVTLICIVFIKLQDYTVFSISQGMWQFFSLKEYKAT